MCTYRPLKLMLCSKMSFLTIIKLFPPKYLKKVLVKANFKGCKLIFKSHTSIRNKQIVVRYRKITLTYLRGNCIENTS